MSKIDLILVLNKILAKIGEKIDIRFLQVKYLPSKLIFAFFIKKTNAGLLISQLPNILIQAIKAVDVIVVGIKILKHWQYFKVYKISLDKYLNDYKIELLRQKI